MNRSLLLLFLLLSSRTLLLSQEDSSALSRALVRHQVQLSLSFQLWSTYSIGTQHYNPDSARYVAVDNRWNTYLRRGRFTISGQPSRALSVSAQVAFDAIGRDLLAAMDGGGNNGPAPQLRLLNAQLQWRVLPGRESLYLIAGYFPLRMGRESLTSSSRSTTMEKAISQNYMRVHLVGIGSGRAGGINLGGLIRLTDREWLHLIYDFSMQNPVYHRFGNNSVGYRFSPLWSGRTVLQVGDPEMGKYNSSLSVNYFGKRRGLSLGLSAARQGATDYFRYNAGLGADLLFNYGPINIDGDISYLYRSGHNGNSGRVQLKTGYGRLSYNFYLQEGRVLEPVVGYWFMHGPLNAETQLLARELGTPAGEDNGLDLGFNLYFNPELKVSLHYTHRRGNAGAADPLTIDNHYFQQAGLGPVRRGDWLGLGVNVVL